MKKVQSFETYIENNTHFYKALELLRSIILSTELEENIKWNAPVYTLQNKNVLSLGAFKHHFGIWFFNGIFLKDEKNILKNAQDGKTKAMRQMRFECLADIDTDLVSQYIDEAIENHKLGKVLKSDRSKKIVSIPEELQAAFNTNLELKQHFETLSNSCQCEYCEYIDSAKRLNTKQIRIQKITTMILEGKGLYNKYKTH
ncbi:DUF1801 domain-containing protein [Tamlana fucoidanivorans]|uniref:YdhG-like domain-containing protein n=1 Tax=Allotamlana fucoidanivorans TaxID=2583814 RepID=A0A5C4SMH0_9FLAO|nr:DUF1801 domain-containing protein [Tamlana fucoidanivorans]TNJ44573.1 hypothetical protein FGF67_07965 [Tamlana fucoidanivorans]